MADRDADRDAGQCCLVQLISNKASKEEIRKYLDAYPQAAAEKYSNGWTPIYIAVRNSNKKAIKMILDAHPKAATEKNDYNHFPLHIAAYKKNPKVVKIILDAHPEAASEKDNDGWFPLHHAAKYNKNPEVVKIILDAHPQAAAGKDDITGWFPLHNAARYNSNPDVVKMILDAYPQAAAVKDVYGSFPLDLAKKYSSKDVIEVLESALEKFMDNAPKEFICPITQSIMEDPVVAVDGNTYERADIVQWFEDHDTSLLTNIVLESKKVVPNRALKSLIDSYMGK